MKTSSRATSVKPLKLKTKKQKFKLNPQRTIEWLGGVSYSNLDNTFSGIKTLLAENPNKEVHLLVNSFGGVTGIGMSFYDAINSWLEVDLTTIGSGDVDSSGILVFLAGKKRYITKNTTMLFHLAGRTFEKDKRFSTREIEAILKEDKLKDYQYACVVADATKGRYSPESILDMMAGNTILTAEEAVNMGLADGVI